jgi:hypothetical protein
VDEKHPQGELISVGNILGPFHDPNGDQVDAGGAEQSHTSESEKQQNL